MARHPGAAGRVSPPAAWSDIMEDAVRVEAHVVRLTHPHGASRAPRTVLREVLAARIGCPPAAVDIIRGESGKPRLAGGEIEFSVSHCDGWCAVALSAECEVGVDVEPIRPLEGMAGIAAAFFPPPARAEYAAAAPHRRPAVFFYWWTRVEAALKAAGRGLDDALSAFQGVSCASCDAVPGLAFAVAARSGRPLVVEWATLDLLRPMCGMSGFDGQSLPARDGSQDQKWLRPRRDRVGERRVRGVV